MLVGDGAYGDAAPLLVTSLERAHGLDDKTWLAHAEFHLGAIAFARGDAETARKHPRAATEWYGAIGDRWGAGDPLRYLGLLARGEGDLTGAAAIFADTLARLRASGTRQAIATALADVATWAVAARKPEEATRLFGASDALREEEGSGFALPGRERYDAARAAATVALGDAAFAEAVARGRSDDLDATLAFAEDMLSAPVGAAPTGYRIAGKPALTGREVEVLRLAARGRSYAEIGDQLFSSPRTVARHLRSIYGKLGVDSRGRLRRLPSHTDSCEGDGMNRKLSFLPMTQSP